MLINLMNWCWILFSILVTGTFVISLIEKSKIQPHILRENMSCAIMK